MILSFTIPGPPVPLARARVVRNPRTGKIGGFTPDRSRAYENLVRLIGQAAVAKLRGWPVDAEYRLTVRLWFGDYRRRDVSNCVKAVEDGLNSVAWVDDSQIAWIDASRGYDARAPRAEVEIESLPVTAREIQKPKRARRVK